MPRPRTYLTAILLLLVMCGDQVHLAAAERPQQNLLVINEDCGHFFTYRKVSQMNVPGLQAWVDQYAGSAVTHLFLNPNGMRASFRSRTRNAIWDPVRGEEPQGAWPQNAKRLHQAGIDPYAVWIARCRAKNISPWLTMRMNDVHQAEDRDNYQHSAFWRKNVRLWRIPNHEHGSGLNYAHAEVRKYQMDFVQELLERYDPDGIELDWMRFPEHLTPGKEREEGRFLTEFMHKARALTRQWSIKRGHPIQLGVRAPAHPDAAAGVGMDAVTWAQLGLVDMIVATPFYFSTDFDIPFELWKKRLAEAPRAVTVIGGVESTARPWISGTPVGNSLETLRGFAASAHDRGAMGVYLFNWMDGNDWPVSARDYEHLLKHGVGPTVVTSKSRRHPVCFRDTVPPGFSMGVQLPADAAVGKTFRVHIGPRPTSGHVWAIAGLAERTGISTARFSGKLNGHDLRPTQDAQDVKIFGGQVARAVQFTCTLSSLRDGYNDLDLRQIAGEPSQQIVWVELRIEPSQ